MLAIAFPKISEPAVLGILALPQERHHARAADHVGLFTTPASGRLQAGPALPPPRFAPLTAPNRLRHLVDLRPDEDAAHSASPDDPTGQTASSGAARHLSQPDFRGEREAAPQVDK